MAETKGQTEQAQVNGQHLPRNVAPERKAVDLATDLAARISGEVRFDDGSRALYATDASNYRQVPIGVVVPRDVEDIIQAVDLCRQYSVPVLMRGAGTSLAGQCCNVAVVLDTSKYMNQVIEIDSTHKLARVQPGLVCDHLRHAAEQHRLTFGPDPATHQYCTLGGMIGNNSCGVHSVMAGKTAENIEELEILTYDGCRLRVGKTDDGQLAQIIQKGGRPGEIYQKLKALRDKYADLIRGRFPNIPRRVSGYNLDQLLPENGFNVARALVGTEGTCGVVLEATARLVYSPPARALLVLGYPDIYTAGDQVAEILTYQPIGLEGFDDRMVENMKRKRLHTINVALLPQGGGWLLVEFGGENGQEACDRARALMAKLAGGSKPPSMKLCEEPGSQKRLWSVRESGLAATSFVPGEKDTWEGWEDAAVAPAKIGGYLRDLSKLLDRYGYRYAFYGHFGDGCVHNRITFDLKTAHGIKTYRAFIEEASDLVLTYGGSFSGEHGDGQSRGELLTKMYGPELVQAFREFKSIWDPQGKMNPGKVVDPYPIVSNLRLGTNHNPKAVKTHFAFPDDQASFSRATLRCIGVGKCRKLDTGTMCPSFMATREEKHSTRGRARLLFEMMKGEVSNGGWRDEHIKEALDLCLACKSCKNECPMKVDIATYKAEFLSHYYRGRLRPRSAYSMGLIHWWAELAALAPGVVNFFSQTRGIREVAKALAGVTPERRMPMFARETFKQWFYKRRSERAGNLRVLLWPDTFTNHFSPDIGQAAVEVLENAGCQVEVPRQNLCCGRPLYDYGMLNLAKHMLRKILESLRPQIREGVPVVVLEPSCAAVFRDELVGLFPDDEDALRLSQQTFLLSEFLVRILKDYQPPQIRGYAMVQGHCHHRSIMGMEDEEKILSRLGLDYKTLDSGCCGMAGNFGFLKENYDVSLKVGDRVLLPAVRNADPETIIIADGFSCREQIAQTTDRRAAHLAQVIRSAYHSE